MTKTKAVMKVRVRKAAEAAPRTAVQEALQVTWLLKGQLKSMQISYLRVGKLLVQVRDQKLFSALGHADMEKYAEERLQLGRASLYRYLQVYDWIGQSHKEWLEPHPKGFIPDLNDVADLMWIECELARTDLPPQSRTELEALRAKALDGRLRETALGSWRRKRQPGDKGLKSFLSSARTLRRRGAALASMPADAITHLDAAIDIIKNALGVQPVK